MCDIGYKAHIIRARGEWMNAWKVLYLCAVCMIFSIQISKNKQVLQTKQGKKCAHCDSGCFRQWVCSFFRWLFIFSSASISPAIFEIVNSIMCADSRYSEEKKPHWNYIAFVISATSDHSVFVCSFLLFHSRYVDSVDNMQTLMTHYVGCWRIETKAPLKVKYETRIWALRTVLSTRSQLLPSYKQKYCGI